MSGPAARLPPDLDPLSTAAVGAALAGSLSLVWPDLVAGTLSLAAVATFVVWVRLLRARRRGRASGHPPIRWLPLLAVGGAGWTLVFLPSPVLPPVRAVVMGTVCLSLWLLARSLPGAI